MSPVVDHHAGTLAVATHPRPTRPLVSQPKASTALLASLYLISARYLPILQRPYGNLQVSNALTSLGPLPEVGVYEKGATDGKRIKRNTPESSIMANIDATEVVAAFGLPPSVGPFNVPIHKVPTVIFGVSCSHRHYFSTHLIYSVEAPMTEPSRKPLSTLKQVSAAPPHTGPSKTASKY